MHVCNRGGQAWRELSLLRVGFSLWAKKFPEIVRKYNRMNGLNCVLLYYCHDFALNLETLTHTDVSNPIVFCQSVKAFAAQERYI